MRPDIRIFNKVTNDDSTVDIFFALSGSANNLNFPKIDCQGHPCMVAHYNFQAVAEEANGGQLNLNSIK